MNLFCFLNSYDNTTNVQKIWNIKLHEIIAIAFHFILSGATGTVDVSCGA